LNQGGSCRLYTGIVTGYARHAAAIRISTNNGSSISYSLDLIVGGDMVLLAAGAWIYRFEKNRAAENKDVETVRPICGSPHPSAMNFARANLQKDDRPATKVAHRNLNVTMRLPSRTTGLPPDAPDGVKEIVLKPGKTDVDVYKHLDSGRSIHTQGTIHLENGNPVLKVLLKMDVF
jgi:hypothetical protein